MPISECCSVEVVCCEPDTPVQEVAELMRKEHVGDVVVVEMRDGKRVPTGIVTDRDIILEIVALRLDISAFTAGDIMNSPLISMHEDEGVFETLRTMRNHRIRRVPVVKEDGTLSGIVSSDDIINLLTNELSMMADTLVDQPAREAYMRR
ncbi:MAG TPA: CBS domain-containing protein [Noviherbaspirillum sp.]|jgi:CBS domain-containing protein